MHASTYMKVCRNIHAPMPGPSDLPTEPDRSATLADPSDRGYDPSSPRLWRWPPAAEWQELGRPRHLLQWHLAYRHVPRPQVPAALPHVHGSPVRGVRRRLRRPVPRGSTGDPALPQRRTSRARRGCPVRLLESGHSRLMLIVHACSWPGKDDPTLLCMRSAPYSRSVWRKGLDATIAPTVVDRHLLHAGQTVRQATGQSPPPVSTLERSCRRTKRLSPTVCNAGVLAAGLAYFSKGTPKAWDIVPAESTNLLNVTEIGSTVPLFCNENHSCVTGLLLYVPW